VAIVVNDPEFCIQWGKEKGYLASDTPPGVATPVPGQPPHPGMVKLAGMKEFKAAVAEDMNRIGQKEKLRGFEFVKEIHLEVKFFSVENGLLTPTFKLKRNEAAVICYIYLITIRPFIDP
jgi:long-chain acyl-CoA synthetase